MAKVRAAPNSSTAVGEDTWRIPDALWERIEPLPAATAAPSPGLP